MKKHKNEIFVVLTVVVIIFCGMLPKIIGIMEDCFADQNIGYGEQKTVPLIRELNDVEKMYLLKNGTEVSISEERTNLKWTNMAEILDAALSWYTQNGFILSMVTDFTITKCEPVLYYSTEVSNVLGIFWKVDMELGDYLGQSISLILDDQTGSILLISYECLESIFDKNDLDTPLMCLFECYQSERGWYNLNFAGQENTEAIEKEPAKYKYKREMIFSYGDVIYGQNVIVFTMTETGFSIRIE